jgi:hypothetical protein
MLPGSTVIFEYVPFSLFKLNVKLVPEIGCMLPVTVKDPVPLYAVPASVKVATVPVAIASTVLIVIVISLVGDVPGRANPAGIIIVCPAP